MSSSDEELQIQQENEFNTYSSIKAPKKQLPTFAKVDEVVQECWRIHRNIIEKQKESLAYQIIQLINMNFQMQSTKRNSQQDQKQGQQKQSGNSQDEKDKKTKSKSKAKRKEKARSKQSLNTEKEQQIKTIAKPQKLIMPICIRKSQQKYLEQFIKGLQDKLLQLFEYQNIQQNQNQVRQIGYKKAKKKTKQFNQKRGRYRLFIGARKINIFFKQQLDSVCSIALYIHQKLKEIHTKDDITIYVTNIVTDLKPQKLYIFQQGLAEQNCLILAPTLSSFQQASYNKFSSMEIIPIKLFQHRELFCQFMYDCICSPEVKAYLPKQSIRMIDEFDDFPITYEQGSRRLIQCIKRLQILKQRKKINFKQVDIKTMLITIQKSLKRTFKIFDHETFVIKKYIKCILDEDQSFNLLDKYLNKANYFLRDQQQGKSQIDLVTNLRKHLKNYIDKEPSIKQFVKFLQQPLQKQKSTKLKSKQTRRYKVQTQFCVDQKNYLQIQIKKLLMSMTNEIRKQAKNFKWQEFRYIEQIKPMLPYRIYQGAYSSPIHYNLLNFIYQKISTPLVRIISHFCNQEQQMQYGQLMYYMKDIEMLGLIDISQNVLNPMVTPAYFQKTSMVAKQMG